MWLVPANHPRYPGQPSLEWDAPLAWRAGLGLGTPAGSLSAATTCQPVAGLAGPLPASGTLSLALPGATVTVERGTAAWGWAWPGPSPGQATTITATAGGQTVTRKVYGAAPTWILASWARSANGEGLVVAVSSATATVPASSGEWPGRPSAWDSSSRQFGAGGGVLWAPGQAPAPGPATATFAVPQAADALAGWFGLAAAPPADVAWIPDAGTPSSRWTGGLGSSGHRAAAWAAPIAGFSGGRVLPALDAIGHPELRDQYLPPDWLWLSGVNARTPLPFLAAAHRGFEDGDRVLAPTALAANLSPVAADNLRLGVLRCTIVGDVSAGPSPASALVPDSFTGTFAGHTVNERVPGVIFAGASRDAVAGAAGFAEYGDAGGAVPAKTAAGIGARTAFRADYMRARADIHRREAGDFWSASNPAAATNRWGLVLRAAFEVGYSVLIDGTAVASSVSYIPPATWLLDEAASLSLFAGDPVTATLPRSGAEMRFQAIG